MALSRHSPERLIEQQESNPDAYYAPAGRIFLLGDHLGSVSVATDNNGQVVSRQDSTPWGEARRGHHPDDAGLHRAAPGRHGAAALRHAVLRPADRPVHQPGQHRARDEAHTACGGLP